MPRTIQLLSDLSYALGLIGLVELEERNQIARWVYSRHLEPDPRGPRTDNAETREATSEEDVFLPAPNNGFGGESSANEQRNAEPSALQFLVLKRWYFTPGDPDCAPSVPHGHENAKTQKWPKLNPYTGKVFTAIHQEDTSRRLSRNEMQILWRDSGFVDHCRDQVKWYAERFPGYRFVSARRGIFAFPRW